MTERFAYLAFLMVVGVGLGLMTLGLAATAVILFLQRRHAAGDTAHERSGRVAGDRKSAPSLPGS